MNTLEKIVAWSLAIIVILIILSVLIRSKEPVIDTPNNPVVENKPVETVPIYPCLGSDKCN